MLIWDTTPIIDVADDISVKESQINAAINWDDLSPEKKEVLTKAKIDLSSSIGWARLVADNGHVGHYVDIQGNISELRHAQDAYLIIVKQMFPYQDVQNTRLSDLLYNKSCRRDKEQCE